MQEKKINWLKRGIKKIILPQKLVKKKKKKKLCLYSKLGKKK